MPDLATHAMLPLLGVRAFEIASRKTVMTGPECHLLVFGGIFPDLIEKSVPYCLYYGFPAATWPRIDLQFLHTPAMLLVATYLFCFFFTESFRRKGFLILTGGILFHHLLDLLQGNVCDSGYMWFFPFNFQRPMPFHWFEDDASVPWVPVLAAALMLTETFHRKIKNGRMRPRGIRKRS